MPRHYSTHFHRIVNSTDADESPLLLLEIHHPDLLSPIRIVNDRQDITHQNNLFIALAFRATLPDDKQEGLPRAALAIDNVGKELVGWLEVANGGKGATCRIVQVMRSDADHIEFEITLNLTNIVITPYEVRGELTYEDLLNKPGIAIEYRPNNTPGLF